MGRLAFLFCLAVMACQSGGQEASPAASVPAPSSKANTPTAAAPETAAPSKAEPAAGLQMTTRGVPLEDAERVVVLFHGYGANMRDLAGFSRRLNAGEGAAFVFPQAPNRLARGGYSWFQLDRTNFEEGLSHARAFVQWVASQAPKARLVIGGFSQGAMLTANLVADAPAQTDAALIFSAADLLPHPPVENAGELELFVSHGRADKVIPFEQGQKLQERFRTAGFQTTWVPFDGPHRIPPEVVTAANEFLAGLEARP